MRKIISLITATIALIGASAVSAYQAGDMIVRGGAVTVQPHKEDIHLKNNTQLGLNFQYMLSSNFGVELLAATPFEHDVALDNGTLALSTNDGYVAGKVKHLPPTISAVFYPLEESSPIQPYLGVGFNYTMILDEEINQKTKDAIGDQNLKLSVKDSFGFAAQFGVDYVLPNNLIINAQMRHIKLTTRATIKDGNGKVVTAPWLDVDPTVYMIGIGYKF